MTVTNFKSGVIERIILYAYKLHTAFHCSTCTAVCNRISYACRQSVRNFTPVFAVQDIMFIFVVVLNYTSNNVQCVPLATEPGISLILLTPMKILQRNLNRGKFVVWEMKSNVSVVCVCSAPNCCDTVISGKIIKEMPGSVASGTHCSMNTTARSSIQALRNILSSAVFQLSGFVTRFYVRIFKKRGPHSRSHNRTI
jgi:hypothetical protein